MTEPPTPALLAARTAANAALPRGEGEDTKAYLVRLAKADAVLFYALGESVAATDLGGLGDEELAKVTRRFGELAAGSLELVLGLNGRYSCRPRHSAHSAARGRG